METIHIKIDKHEAISMEDPSYTIVCNNNDYEIEFNFVGEEWQNKKIKTALFYWEGRNTGVPFTGNVCKVPIITNPNNQETFKIFIGVSADYLTTTTPALFYGVKSALSGFEELDPPSDDVYNRLIDLINIGAVNGKSAYEIAVEHGYIGTEAEWIEMIQAHVDPASKIKRGVVQIGNNIDVTDEGTISVRTTNDKSEFDTTPVSSMGLFREAQERQTEDRLLSKEIADLKDETKLDISMSDFSTFGVQNKVIKKYVDDTKISIQELIEQEKHDRMSQDEGLADYILRIDSGLILDEELSNYSIRGVQNKAIKKYIDKTITILDSSMTDYDMNHGLTKQGIKDYVTEKTTYDTELNIWSKNAVENKVIKQYIDDKVLPGELLWVNTKSDIPFGRQEIPIGTNKYNFILILYKHSKDINKFCLNQVLYKNITNTFAVTCLDENIKSRGVYFKTGFSSTSDSVLFEDCDDNNFVIPVYIFGIK